MACLKDFLDDEGFIRVDEIVHQGLEEEFFPGLLPSSFREREFPQWVVDAPERHYLDNTATSPPLRTPLERGFRFLIGKPFDQTGLIHRTASDHSRNYDEAWATELYKERAKDVVKEFFGASQFEIAMTFNASFSSNIVGAGIHYGPDDVVILQRDNHNSQILTPRRFAQRAGARVVYVPLSVPEGKLDLHSLQEIAASLGKRRGKVIMFATHASNVSGVVHPVNEVVNILRTNVGDRAFIYLDIAQSAAHLPIRLDDFGEIDTAGVSAHKVYGLKGVGALFVRKGREDQISHGLTGGGTVEAVDEDGEVLAPSPERFEIGTQNIEGFIEWSFVLEQLREIGMSKIEMHNATLGRYLLGEMCKLQDRGVIELYGPRVYRDRIPVFTYNIGSWREFNHEEVAKLLNDAFGIANRNGCFCAPLCLSDLMNLPVEQVQASMQRIRAGEHQNTAGAVRCSVGINTGILDAFIQIRAVREVAKRLLGAYRQRNSGRLD